MKNNPEVIINPSGSIHIADHVWIGKRSAVLKNVDIGENTVVGMGSIVTKSVSSSCIVVGSPAKVIREGVNWDRRHINI
jgi:acetyltransferase-like isoleucine patch superfamily enzyme